ncbi:MAG TPA: malonate transporter subunit MadL [Chitinophagaceae bacterium]|nr:malonate transporter subunit MadL [Chitinophagaceae bacterium]
MLIYGVAILSGCYILGQIIGESLGKLLHIDASVGGVGFAMLLLILVNHWMHKRKWFTAEMDMGVLFWNKMYIPVIVAMSASQNVAVALAGGMVALLAGGFAVAFSFLLIPYFSKLAQKQGGI